MQKAKPISFLGNSLSVIREFPDIARIEAGAELYRVQRDLEPSDWKPMPSIGAGVRELRIRDETGAFRVVYLAKYDEAVYVLHAFQKKTEQTAKRDIDLAIQRLKQIKVQ